MLELNKNIIIYMDKFEIYQWETADHKIFSIMNNTVVF